MSLSEIRSTAGLSQSKLAEKSGVNIRAIQHYEQGTKNINHARLLTLLKLCDALDCKLSDIITDDEIIKLLNK